MFKTKDNISKVTIIIGIIVIIFAGYNYFNSKDNIQNGKIVKARIIDYKKNSDGKNEPIVLYVVNNDTLTLSNSRVLDTYPKENRINVKYNEKNPKEAIIYESYIELGIPLSIATIGIMMVLFGLTMLYFTWKKRV